MATKRMALVNEDDEIENIILVDSKQEYEPPEGLTLRKLKRNEEKGWKTPYQMNQDDVASSAREKLKELGLTDDEIATL